MAYALSTMSFMKFMSLCLVYFGRARFGAVWRLDGLERKLQPGCRAGSSRINGGVAASQDGEGNKDSGRFGDEKDRLDLIEGGKHAR